LSRTGVKICGLTRRKDALFAARAGADFLGVVLIPESPRFLEPERARIVVEGIPVPAVVVVSGSDPSVLAEAALTVGASVIQLHGEEDPEVVLDLKARGSWAVWKALRIRDAESLRRGLHRFGAVADGLLLDAWHPTRQGGTGRAFPWKDVAEACRAFPPGLDLVVAGGLTPENVPDAIRSLRPGTVDVSSGVEVRPGVKDQSRLRLFIENVRATSQGRQE